MVHPVVRGAMAKADRRAPVKAGDVVDFQTSKEIAELSAERERLFDARERITRRIGQLEAELFDLNAEDAKLSDRIREINDGLRRLGENVGPETYRFTAV